MYTQSDLRWAGLSLGDSPYTCAGYGCLATDWAEALTLAGYNITPLSFIATMNSIGGFTDKHYLESSPGKGDGQPGLLIWAKVAEAYPQVHLDTGDEYIFQKGILGHFTHWILKNKGNIYDPLYGLPVEPSGFEETTHRTASIDPAPVDTIPAFTPFEVNLEPSQTYSDEVKRMQSFLITQGLFTDQGTNNGYYGPKTQKAVDAFQKAHGIASATKFGWWYDKTREVANSIINL